MTLRRSLERRSGPVLVLLGRAPRAVPFLIVLALLVGGLALTGPAGGVLLLVLLAFAAWVTYLAWPALHPGPRVVRVVVLALLLAAAAGRF